MSEFTVRGTFETHRGENAFETTVDAPNEAVAREHTYANIGGRHGLKRQRVAITEVDGQ
jgi:large subunit ribosomal protein LX